MSFLCQKNVNTKGGNILLGTMVQYSETGGRHALADVMGQVWDGPECIDDYCD